MPGSSVRSVLFLVLTALTGVGLAGAQEPAQPPSPAELSNRVRELEEAVRRLQENQQPAITPTAGSDAPAPPQASPPPTPAPPTPEPPDESRSPFAGWEDGFLLRSADGKYTLRITGQIQADYRAFLDGTDTTDIDTFLLRRARLGIEATVFQVFEFRLLPDFGQSTVTIQDAYMNVHAWDAFQFEAGKFKQPVSYEQLIQDRFVPTMERSLIDQLVPARDEGVMIHGTKLLWDRLDYAISVSNGEINGNGDTNDRKDLNARVVVRPLNDEAIWPELRLLQFGISGSTGKEQENISPNILRTPATVPWFQFNNGVRANGLRTRWTPELSWFSGPFGFAAQYFGMDQSIAPNTGVAIPPRSVRFDGFYVLGTVLLTGESRKGYSEAITPLHPFDPLRPLEGCGAWELVGRVSHLEVGRTVFIPGPGNLANPDGNSSAATEMTLGFNWYMNKWARVQFNWEHAWFDDPVRLGPGPNGLLKHEDSLLMRFQVIF
jgi:phosphate-selective porin OprO/OprP